MTIKKEVNLAGVLYAVVHNISLSMVTIVTTTNCSTLSNPAFEQSFLLFLHCHVSLFRLRIILITIQN